MTNKKYRELLKDQIRVVYSCMKDAKSIELLEYYEGHAIGILSAFHNLEIISCKVRYKYQDFIVAVYESRKAVINND